MNSQGVGVGDSGMTIVRRDGYVFLNFGFEATQHFCSGMTVQLYTKMWTVNTLRYENSPCQNLNEYGEMHDCGAETKLFIIRTPVCEKCTEARIRRPKDLTA